MNEHSFIRALHRRLTPAVHKWKINDPGLSGVADAFYSGKGGHLFVEYKWLPALPKRDTTRFLIDLSPAQLLWLGGRYDDNIVVAVIVGFPEGGVLFLDKDWETHYTLADIIPRIQSHKALAEWIQESCVKELADGYSENKPNERPGGRSPLPNDGHSAGGILPTEPDGRDGEPCYQIHLPLEE